MSRLTRHTRILGAVAIACVAVVGLLSASEDTPKRRDAPAVASRSQPAVRADAVRLDLLKRGEQNDPNRDLFASTTPPPPPPPPPAPPPPPPKPTAPALPFAAMGKLETAGEPTIYYLQEGDTVHAVVIGDTISSRYRVESVANGVMELLYLPLQIKQTLSVGGDS